MYIHNPLESHGFSGQKAFSTFSTTFFFKPSLFLSLPHLSPYSRVLLLLEDVSMSSTTRNLHFSKWVPLIIHLLTLLHPSLSLNQDGIHLISLKYSILKDPLSVLQGWNYDDETPCSWNGVLCTSLGLSFRVISLSLPNSQLTGSIPSDLGLIQHLQHLDLSNNFLTGSLPNTIFNISQLTTLSLSNNFISGEIPEFVGNLKSLELLNLSNNALTGKIPQNLTTLPNLTILSLSKNNFSGEIPTGFSRIEALDLSSNLINTSLSQDLVLATIHYLNLSNNKLFGRIPSEFANKIIPNTTIDLSFNNLTGEIPESPVFKTEFLLGNVYLCGKPLTNPCIIPSTHSTYPDSSEATSAPAIAAIPRELNSTNDTQEEKDNNKLRPEAIAGIIVGDLAGIGLLCIVFLYIYQSKKKKNQETSGSRSDTEEEVVAVGGGEEKQEKKVGSLVMVDGETELELETLLKASAYVLGATGSSIVYKAVLQDGTEFAVRRIGESGLERFRDFANQVRVIAKLRHPNLVRVRGYCWGADEKLIIYDYVPNGSLANACYKKTGSSPYQLPWEGRLTIAKGVARALTYLHEKKHVHGNLKPSNILLGPNMKPKIGDFGLERLVWGGASYNKSGGSARYFGSKRSSISRDSPLPHDLPIGASPSFGSTSISPYLAPEALKNIKANPRWDVYSFGIILLELLTGKIFMEAELTQWNTGFVVEERNRILRMADVGIRADVEGKEDVLMTCFRLGFSCASMVPQKRPYMKEVLHILEKVPTRS